MSPATSMQFTNFLSAIVWPLVALSALIIFRAPIAELLKKVSKAKVGPIAIGTSAQGLRRANAIAKRKLKTDLEEIEILKKRSEELLAHEQQFDSSDDAFVQARHFIEAWLIEQRNAGNKEPLLNLKLITIAMTFSCRFVTQHIPKIIERYPEAKISLQILIVDPLFLDSLQISNHPVRYGETCRDSIRQIWALLDDTSRHQGRLSLTLRRYKHLPQWHGLLIGEDHLFLGRTDWKFPENQKPALSVGQNTYRHYGRGDLRGAQRIQLFENWHRYFSDFGSEPLSPESPDEKGILPFRRN